MPRRPKGPRLYVRERQGREPAWVILDRGVETSTGFGLAQRAEAEAALEDYLGRKRLTTLRACDPSQVTIDEILGFYTDGRGEELARADMVAGIVPLLMAHAGTDSCAAINGDWCRAYIKKRTTGKIAPAPRPGRKPKLPKPSSVRRDLEHLSAALGYAVKEGILAYAPKITYPKAPKARERFLTRDEAARLLWTCWRYKQHGPKNQVLYPLRHLCRFILMGIYTGTRSSAILSASFTAAADRSFIDLHSGVFYRLAEGRAETKKRQPPIGLPDRMLAHLRRWQPKSNSGWLVTFHGEPVASVTKGFGRAVQLAGLGEWVEGKDGAREWKTDVSPHVLRHTFMTWVLTAGLDLHTAAKIAGMSAKTADRVYGHLDTSRRDGLNQAFRAGNRGHNMGAKRTSAARSA
jgi:integrase